MLCKDKIFQHVFAFSVVSKLKNRFNPLIYFVFYPVTISVKMGKKHRLEIKFFLPLQNNNPSFPNRSDITL